MVAIVSRRILKNAIYSQLNTEIETIDLSKEKISYDVEVTCTENIRDAYIEGIIDDIIETAITKSNVKGNLDSVIADETQSIEVIGRKSESRPKTNKINTLPEDIKNGLFDVKLCPNKRSNLQEQLGEECFSPRIYTQHRAGFKTTGPVVWLIALEKYLNSGR